MRMQIEMQDTRGTALLPLDEDFKDYVKGIYDDYYSIFCRFVLYTEDENKIGEIVAFFFDEKRIDEDKELLIDVADSIDEDIYAAMEYLTHDKEYLRSLVIKSKEQMLTCYLQTVYIEPEYRNMGIGTYIFENMFDIFEYYTNLPIRAICTVPTPQRVVASGKSFHYENIKDDEMKTTMIDMLENNGFNRILNSDCFAKVCKYYL